LLGLLRRRDFALLWTASLVSVAGDWVMYAALPFFVFTRTGSTTATAGMIAAELGPSALLGPAAGVYVDRWERKRVIVGANLAQAAAVLALLLVTSGRWLWLVYVVAAAQSVAASFAQPAESALLPALVPEDDLAQANALGALNNRLARLAGVPVGGVLLGSLGLVPVVVVDAASFAVAALLVAPIATLTVARSAGERRSSFVRELRDGLALMRTDRGIVLLFAVLGLMTFGGTMLDPLQAAWVRDFLHSGADVYGTLLSVHAAFGIAGTLAVGLVARRVVAKTMIGWSCIVAATALGIRFNVSSLAVAYSLTAVSGVTSVVAAVGVQTLVQQAVRPDFRGRVFGALGASGALLSLAGAAVGGVLGDVVGVRLMLDVASALVALSGAVVLRAFR
jgi:MFS family permease